MTTKQLYLVAGGILLIVIYAYFAQKQVNKEDNQYYMEFDNAQLNGKLVSVRIARHATAIKVEGIENEFWFIPDTDDPDRKHDFVYFAEPGDSIIKPRHSSTLTLIKNGKEYFYTFKK
ncbi:MAG: hypothetical protein Q8940_18885 [Bacteroidota bacterium]|nr:hypothetical protein [Bacteroidota bacterium]